MSFRRIPIELRFWLKVNKEGPIPEHRPELGKCWVWLLGKSNGYGRIWVDGETISAHVWSYEDKFGPVPPGLEIDHLCRNRSCANPDHMEAVTAAVNTLRGYGAAAKNARKTHCKRGHPFDEGNTYAWKNGYRSCRACQRENGKRFDAANRQKRNAAARDYRRRLAERKTNSVSSVHSN